MCILAAILANCVTLAMADPNADPENPSSYDKALVRQGSSHANDPALEALTPHYTLPKNTRPQEYAEYVFLAVFTLEMGMKLLALGFYGCGPSSYVREPVSLGGSRLVRPLTLPPHHPAFPSCGTHGTFWISSSS
jgi:hypothetical protein